MVNETRNEKITVGTSSTLVSEANPNRKLIYIKNTSTGGQTITVCFSDAKPATLNEGIVLSPGQDIIDSDSMGYECYKGTITAISDASGGQLSIYER